MKKILLLVVASFSMYMVSYTQPLTKAERKKAAKSLKETWKAFDKSTKGLSEAQLNFKAGPDRWSVKECAYHLAISENAIWQWMESVAKAPANPDKRDMIKMSDDQLMSGISDRTNKVKTSEPFEPKNAKWGSLGEAKTDMGNLRKAHIEYVNSTSDELRNHVAEQTPVGAMDTYQMILFMSGHTTRHTKQIEEVKADPNFPKS